MFNYSLTPNWNLTTMFLCISNWPFVQKCPIKRTPRNRAKYELMWVWGEDEELVISSRVACAAKCVAWKGRNRSNIQLIHPNTQDYLSAADVNGCQWICENITNKLEWIFKTNTQNEVIRRTSFNICSGDLPVRAEMNADEFPLKQHKTIVIKCSIWKRSCDHQPDETSQLNIFFAVLVV